ncbi:O-antigen ligase family protein [Ulvibacterium marinum]|uniref:O-antigen ligase family protein n=1 Tax=Ulvibacterium marinum TaxID=2419782 RepID=A0A3B0C3Y3_9FLAO|nr:O-antigen ligase family protein [Ulvibacterium marinum]RKN77976.1 O-antigen ligase family protein [Ulvibacterium marinum]
MRLGIKHHIVNNAGILAGTVFIVLVLITSYDDVWKQTSSSVGANILLSSILAILLLFAILSKKKPINFDFVDIILALLFIYAMIFLFIGFNVEYAMYNARWLFLYSIAYILGRRLRTTTDRRNFYVAIYSIALYQAFISIGQVDMGKVFENGLSEINSNKIKGNFSNSSMLAFLMSTGILIGISFLKKKVSAYSKAGVSLSLLPLFLILFATTSRAALLMIVLGIPILLKVKWKYMLLAGALTISLFLTFKKESISGRLLIWKVSTEIIKDNPILGIGANRFGAIYNKYQGLYFEKESSTKEERWVSGDNYFSFNLPLKIIIEYGAIGFLFFCLAIFFLLRKIRHDLSLLSLLAAFFVFSLFSYPLDQMESSFLFFGFIGIGCSLKESVKYKMPSNYIKIANIIFFIFLFFVVLTEITTLNALKNWERQKVISNSSPKSYIRSLHQLHNKLEGFPEFLFHYGAILVENNKTKTAMEPFQLCSNRISSSSVYTYLGICYEAIKDNDKALQNYEFATKVVPNLFVPKYYLFLFYKKMGHYHLAKKTALEIMQQPVKNYNPKILEIKEDLSNFVRK